MGRYRASGADLPFGNLGGWHGVSMEGYFWRFTDPSSARVLIALVGINTPASGPAWATVGIAAEPEGVLASAELPSAEASSSRLALRVADQVVADEHRVRIAVQDCEVDLRIERPQRWPRRAFGGSSYFHLVPGLNQYWHPWLLGGSAHGSVVLGGVRTELAGWQVYGEKNWGRGGFPTAWWWGQAHGFAEPSACVAFAGGRITAGPSILGRRWETEVTALVVALPGGRVLRLGNPGSSAVRSTIGPGQWLLRGRSARWRVEVEGCADPAEAFVLPVPLVEEGRNVPGDLEHLTGVLRVRVREWGREVWRGETSLAGLELGGRELAEAELRTRGGDPRPRAGRQPSA